ncbi:MAG: conserved repeat domain protein [Gemmatimonadetes bacterium]|jgi:uncharacterized repeat protein (TIGR01451 family)|nr:conserved repeat domain protein [Gemmatimonadota bacterium]
MTRFTRITLTLAAALIAVPVAQPVAAQQAASSAPSIVVSARNTTAAAEVARKARPVARTTVQPGDVLRYTLTFTNSTAKVVRDVELRDPIPAGVQFIAGSARASRADARLEFSADAGKSWAAQPMENVIVDGRPVARAVPAARYTHVRWVFAGAVPANGTVTADFDVRVNGAGAGA